MHGLFGKMDIGKKNFFEEKFYLIRPKLVNPISSIFIKQMSIQTDSYTCKVAKCDQEFFQFVRLLVSKFLPSNVEFSSWASGPWRERKIPKWYGRSLRCSDGSSKAGRFASQDASNNGSLGKAVEHCNGRNFRCFSQLVERTVN